jgi:hypothetical protein
MAYVNIGTFFTPKICIRYNLDNSTPKNGWPEGRAGL